MTILPPTWLVIEPDGDLIVSPAGTWTPGEFGPIVTIGVVGPVRLVAPDPSAFPPGNPTAVRMASILADRALDDLRLAGTVGVAEFETDPETGEPRAKEPMSDACLWFLEAACRKMTSGHLPRHRRADLSDALREARIDAHDHWKRASST
ncbi:hypothetical protein [Actinomadura sp. SCN-SB]|uniref:hypothetical protein n=1 Tax=Actinomadura sp. SCN-SB TaxID=3373092 RepID=UPI003753D2F7